MSRLYASLNTEYIVRFTPATTNLLWFLYHADYPYMRIEYTDRYQLDHDYAIKKAMAERDLFSLMGWSDKLEDYIR